MKNNIFWIIITIIIIISLGFLLTRRKTAINSDLTSDQLIDKQVISDSSNPQTESAMDKKQYDQQPTMQIDETKQYQVTLRTSKGDITIKLHADQTPITVNNFVFLAKEGFYDNTIFHRAIQGFMIQGGDPEGTGRGGPGYKFADEPFTGEYNRGTVAMANAGPNTNGSQFFIMHQDYALPANYVIFGEVVSGMETVDAIATAPVAISASGERSKPVTPVTIQSIQVVEN